MASIPLHEKYVIERGWHSKGDLDTEGAGYKLGKGRLDLVAKEFFCIFKTVTALNLDRRE